VFDALESSDEVQSIEDGKLWDDADDVGSAYEDIYNVLGNDQKLLCFRRMCRVAISCHRYSVMHAIRRVYGDEDDEEIRAELLAILNKEDPTLVIHGRGIIPDRTPAEEPEVDPFEP